MASSPEPPASPPFTIRRIRPEDEDVVRELLITGFTGNIPNFYSAMWRGMWHYAAAAAVAVAGAAAAMPSHAVQIVAGGAATGALATLGLRSYFKREMTKYIHKALADDASSISTYYTEESKGPGTGFWVAEENGTIFGCVGLHRRTEDTAEFRRLSVAKHARGRGVAGVLTQHVVDTARAAGIPKLFLTTSNGQPAAIRLYTSAGWTVTEIKRFLGIEIRRFELELGSGGGTKADAETDVHATGRAPAPVPTAATGTSAGSKPAVGAPPTGLMQRAAIQVQA